MIKTTLAKLLTVKVAAAAVAIFAVGGVATAAATGALPLPAGGSAPATSASSLPAATGSSDAPASTRGQGKTRAENEPSPSPSLTGLCHAYTAGNKAEHGKALESPAFTALVTAAGGKTKVDDYCITLLKDESAKPVHTDSPEPTAAPGHSGDDHGAGAGHPTGAPATHPTGPPTTHPTR